MGKGKKKEICEGKIDTGQINDTHSVIREIVEEYNEINLEVSRITQTVRENWVGKGRNEFESQYNMLISKVEDFGETLKDIYSALVKAEAEYEESDDKVRQKYAMAMKK